jgi:hypothetical protein
MPRLYTGVLLPPVQSEKFVYQRKKLLRLFQVHQMPRVWGNNALSVGHRHHQGNRVSFKDREQPPRSKIRVGLIMLELNTN